MDGWNWEGFLRTCAGVSECLGWWWWYTHTHAYLSWRFFTLVIIHIRLGHHTSGSRHLLRCVCPCYLIYVHVHVHVFWCRAVVVMHLSLSWYPSSVFNLLSIYLLINGYLFYSPRWYACLVSLWYHIYPRYPTLLYACHVHYRNTPSLEHAYPSIHP